PAVRVVMLSMRDEPATVSRALQLGAQGFVSKGAPASEVLTALRSVAAGRRYLPPHLASPVVQAMVQSRQQARDGDGPAGSPLDALSLRERQVMQALCEGRSSAEIATTLAVSSKTVDTYRARLMGKLGVRDLASLVRLALREGLIGDR
nr:response regulator transcription factor [Burkholderiaceae bacterium]